MTLTTEELIRGLREVAHNEDSQLCFEAADRLDQLSRANAQLPPHSDDARVLILGPKDSAFIVRDDYTEEVRMPAGPMDKAIPLSAYMVGRAVMALHDPEVCALIDARLQQAPKLQ